MCDGRTMISGASRRSGAPRLRACGCVLQMVVCAATVAAIFYVYLARDPDAWPEWTFYPALLGALALTGLAIVVAPSTRYRIGVLLCGVALMVVGYAAGFMIGRENLCTVLAPPDDQALFALRIEPSGFMDGRAYCRWSKGFDEPVEEVTSYSIMAALARAY